MSVFEPKSTNVSFWRAACRAGRAQFLQKLDEELTYR
jgi:hypothetical protein